jgi:hypothetical protein
MPVHRAPIHRQVAKKSEVAYGEPLNGSPAESLLCALCVAKCFERSKQVRGEVDGSVVG